MSLQDTLRLACRANELVTYVQPRHNRLLQVMDATLLALNSQARDFIVHENPVKALKVLVKAQSLLESAQPLALMYMKFLTCYNLGLAYKSAKLWGKSLESFNQALQFEEYAETSMEHVSLHLNLASVYCSLHKHRQALFHNEMACALLKANKLSKRTAAMLALAVHNLATELQHLSESQEATEVLQKGYELVSPVLGKTNHLTKMLESSQSQPILRRVLANRKPQPSPISARDAAKTKSVQRTRHIYMQDIARTSTLIKQRPCLSSRLEDLRKSLKLKAIKSKTARNFLQSTPSKRFVFKLSSSQSPPKHSHAELVVPPPKRNHAESVTARLSHIEEMFAKVNNLLQKLKRKNHQLQEIGARRWPSMSWELMIK